MSHRSDQVDPPGTCHRVGCPDKGKPLTGHRSHETCGVKIGAADSWQAYAGAPVIPQPGCLGVPWIEVKNGELYVRCSLDEMAWSVNLSEPHTPADYSHIVDVHKRECPNRKATP